MGRLEGKIAFLTGAVHPCCYDWRGCVELGNVHDAPFAGLVARWQVFREAVSGESMTPNAPEACRRCSMRGAGIPDFVPAVADAARRRGHAGPLAVVAAAYRIPEHRVRDFCAWNDAAFRALRARVYLAVEKPYAGLPEYVRQVPYPEPMKVFSIARTKNAGLAAALAEKPACSVAVATDIDVVLSSAALEFMALTPAGVARVPVYLMADNYPERAARHVPAPLATGTVAMTAAGWGKVRYDERCEGYGSEDAIVLLDIAAAGMAVDRMPGLPVHHIAHQAGTPQREFHGRTDHWGRAEGFNPENFRANNQFRRERAVRQFTSCSCL